MDACGVVSTGGKEKDRSSSLTVFADGTGFRGEGLEGKARKGELKAVIGVNEDGEVVPLGTYTDKSWPEISRDWKDRKIKLPTGSMLICDGELGLADAFADCIPETQNYAGGIMPKAS